MIFFDMRSLISSTFAHSAVYYGSLLFPSLSVFMFDSALARCFSVY